jgi:hypothetical protein
MRCIGFFGYGVPDMLRPPKHCQFFMIVQRWALLPQAVFATRSRVHGTLSGTSGIAPRFLNLLF